MAVDKRSSWTTNDTYVTSSIKESETMIAWKRVYIEQDNMYKLGATITANAPAGATNLRVDSTADFSVGDSVVVFWTNGTFNTTINAKPPAPVNSIYITSGGSGYTSAPSVNITGGGGTNATATATIDRGRVVSITLTSGGTGYTSPPTVNISGSATAAATLGLLEVPAIPSEVRRFAGIRPAVEPDTYEVDRRYLTNAFGRLPDGSDGGAFIEFLDAPSGSGKVPKYTVIVGSAELRAYCLYWFSNYENRTSNVLYLLAANRHVNNRGTTPIGTANTRDSRCIVWDGQKISVAQRDNTTAHEIGHRFGLIRDRGGRFDHIDNPLYSRPPVPIGKVLLPQDRWSHCNLDACLMSYARNREDATVEFSIPCLLTGSSDGARDSLRDVEDY